MKIIASIHLDWAGTDGLRRVLGLMFLVIPLTSSYAPAQEDEAIAKEPAVANKLSVQGAILKTIETTTIAARVSGVLSSIKVREGTRVKAGTEIGTMHDSGVRIQVEKAKVALDQVKKKQANDIDKRLAAKSLAVAKNEYDRALIANAKVSDVYPRNEVDRLKLIMDRTTLEVERSEYARELLSMDVSMADLEYQQNLELLQRHCIVAACDGVIVSVDRRPGEWIEIGGAVATIVEIDRLRIEGFMLASDASPELIGTMANVSVESVKSIIETTAEVVFISPEVNPLNSQVRVFLEVDNREGKLRPGLRPKVLLNAIP
ncbi:MAG: efflux RND transporter periplasmic adaptor subunit [Pirellula sp.]